MVKKINEGVKIGNLIWADWVFDDPDMNIENINYALKTLDEIENLYRNSKGSRALGSLGDLNFELLETIRDMQFQMKGLKKEVNKRNKQK